ncbi:MAG: putative Kynurenine 3-monooxygenase, siderophore biosynthesis [Actinomycetota bacterium]
MSGVAVIGAGPAGALAGVYLARQGLDVTIYERRADLRRTAVETGRSINLALATRGIVPLVDVGVIERVDEITIPMRGRIVHAADGTPAVLQPYGRRPHEVIHSVSRTDLNAILLDAAEETGRVEIRFSQQIRGVDLAARTVRLDGGTEPFEWVIGADGAGSVVRQALGELGVCTHRTEWLDHDYKELTLPPADDGSHRLDPHGLHIWPRGELMVIALANPSGDFTVTLFAPSALLAELDRGGAAAFFAREFADLAAMIPDLDAQFAAHPTGALGTLWADGWCHEDVAVLVGDAAHAIVPFHGQGMNAAMESVRLLDRHLRARLGDRAAAFRAYERERKPDADAIAAMALDNYVEMRAGVVDPRYLAKRALALALEERHPRRLSPRYNMVMFSTMPYSEARRRAAEQNDILEAALADPAADVDALVARVPELPDLDPLADPAALST